MSVVEQYLSYLNIPKVQFDGVLKKPASDKIINKFTSFNKLHQSSSEESSLLVTKALEENRKILVWSDQHFNHDILWMKGYRPFKSREEQTQVMLASLSNINKDDLLIFGGDLCFYNVKEILEVLINIECEKIYVLGNHDVGTSGLVKSLLSNFDSVSVAFSFKMPINHVEKEIVVSHYPIAVESLLPNQINMHGHTHGFMISEKHINICVENTNYGVIDIQEAINKHEERYNIQL